MQRFIAAFAAGLAIFAAHAHNHPANFVAWREGLHSSSQPTAQWLARVREEGYDAVVNLAPPQSQGSIRDEGGIVASKGVVYVNIPVDFGNPTAEDFRIFVETLKALRAKKVFVHCQVNMRGSAFTFLYRVLHEGADIGESARRMNAVWTPNPVWKRFLDDTLAAHGRKGEVY